jgi:predicted nucleic acid-binding protein
MNIVVDANVVAALILPLNYSDDSTNKMGAWKENGVEIFTPLLIDYEITTILRRAVSVNIISRTESLAALDKVLALNFQSLPPTREMHQRALMWAEKLGQAKAYDSQYIAVAEQINAEFWTADKSLFNTLRAQGMTWSHWIGE